MGAKPRLVMIIVTPTVSVRQERPQHPADTPTAFGPPCRLSAVTAVTLCAPEDSDTT